MDFSGFNFDGIAPKPGSPSKMAGSDGVGAPGGMLLQGERNPRLAGDQKWITFANLIRGTLIVASAYRAYDALARSAKWTAEANPLGGRKAKKMADIARDGLLEAPMPKPWTAIVGKTVTGAKFHGFSMHEWQGKKRTTPGNPWVFTNIEHRPQHTIFQWLKPNEREPWVGVVQRTKLGGIYPIARSRLFYVVDDTMTDQPDGAGFLQHLMDHADHLRVFEKLEGHGFQTNLAGVPIGRAPLARLRNEACAALNLSIDALSAEDEAKVSAYVKAQVKFLSDFLQNHIKTPDLSILLDSSVYMATKDGGTMPSTVYEWVVDVVKTSGLSLTELADAINRVGRELARVMNVEWMMMGDSEGARSVHADKTDMFLLVVNSILQQVGYYATSQLAWPMTELNGFDPETCCPKLVPQPIPMETIESVCRALQLFAQAGQPVPPGWEGTNIILGRANLPPFPVSPIAENAMLPRAGRGDPKKTPDSATKPKADPKANDAGGDDPNVDNAGVGATA